MTLSMTGYASRIINLSVGKKEKLSLAIQLKSLNARYFESSCKLPFLLNHLEVEIQQMLKRKLHRGNIFLSVRIQSDTIKHNVVPALQTIKSYLSAVNIIKKECKIEDTVSLESLLQLPNILQVEEQSLAKKTNAEIINSISSIADDLIESRAKEGKRLAQDIQHHAKEISKNIAAIKKATVSIIKEKREKLEEIMTTLQAFDTEEPSAEQSLLELKKNTLLTELDKIDINEEIVRASFHLQSIDDWIDLTDNTKGKKLDFVLQELNREINTIASKCSNITISKFAINSKSELEKSREQVQNIL